MLALIFTINIKYNILAVLIKVFQIIELKHMMKGQPTTKSLAN